MNAARVLFSTGSLHVMDTAGCFELAADAGFDGIEILCDDRWGTRDPRYLKKLSARHGLPVLAAHTPFSWRIPGWQDSNPVQRITQTLRLAETLAAEVVVVHLPHKIDRVVIQWGKHRFWLPRRSSLGPVKRWIEETLPGVQQQTPVKICIENMPAKRFLGRRINPIWWNTVAGWSRVHDWLTLDTTHWGTLGVDPLDAYKAAGARVGHVHLSNFDGREHRQPHKGELDLGALLRAMAADGYAGAITVELDPSALPFTDDDALRRSLKECLAFCRQHLGQ